MGAVSSRDFVLEAMQWGSFLMTHISRLVILMYTTLHNAYFPQVV